MGFGQRTSKNAERAAKKVKMGPRRWLVPLAATAMTGATVEAVAVIIGLTEALITLTVLLVPLCWLVAMRFATMSTDVKGMVYEMDTNYEAIISLLSGALGLHDSVTLSHSTRISQLSAVIAWEMGLRREQVRLIEKAAILHDIGKLGIAEDVLGKTGNLTDRDWSEMRRHPQLGYEILTAIESLADSAEIVWAHHERFDGQGYPRNLRGDEIPIGARIFAVADAYVAMTSGRPYRKTLSHTMAVKEIVRNSLTQFDPEVVEAFLSADRKRLIVGHAAEVPEPKFTSEPVVTEA